MVGNRPSYLTELNKNTKLKGENFGFVSWQTSKILFDQTKKKALLGATNCGWFIHWLQFPSIFNFRI